MKEIFEKLIKKGRIAVLGFGREGKATYNLFRTLFPEIPLTIADADEKIVIKYPELLQDKNLQIITGSDYIERLSDVAVVIKSPGISSKSLKILQNVHITSQTAIFLEKYRNQVIGVTGTKGKSTTSSLIHHILSQENSCIIIGNIGLPAFDSISEISPDTFIVFELSSHQLEDVDVSPHIAVLLNIFEEHLDHYSSYEEYQQAKMNIARFQNQHDFLVYGFNNEIISNLLRDTKMYKGRRFPFSLENSLKQGCWQHNGQVVVGNQMHQQILFNVHQEFPLKGQHNLLNIMASCIVAEICQISVDVIRESVLTFTGLSHRLEYVGTYDGIIFYNDSIATIPEASIAAIKALENVNTILLGGFDRGINYINLAEFLSQSAVENILLTGNAGKRILSELQSFDISSKYIEWIGDFETMVERARQITKRGGICLLSPAASSYDAFKNFEQRGDIYKKLVSKGQLSL